MNRAELTALWKTEIADKAANIDTHDPEVHWLYLCYGWALAKGLPPAAAYEFALYIRYDTDLG